eukprot:TRINITY_DN3624_c0_g1_i2.p1 TRINITY_DN3624_c0_g1~~TRINITY_DN3624_c0_g1_i2.p1  ORF type:complete len:352 (-),score=22.37 TRINITY_DN3624_c0_g1_i2:218-1273(-)
MTTPIFVSASFFLRKYRIQLLFLLIFFGMLFFWIPLPKRHVETVMLTGGLGFIGSTLVDELLIDGFRVVIFDDESTGHNYNDNAITIIGDITFPEDFAAISLRVDYIVHFAAAISVAESMSNPKKYDRINIDGSRNVLEWAVRHKVKKVVAASSAAVYGTPKVLPLEETAPLGPISPYATTKLDMEHLLQEYHEKHGLHAIALRFFNVYGPRQDPKSSYSGVISKFLDLADTGKDIVIYGDGKNTRDFVFVSDVARANIAALQHGTGFRVYNVGTETVTTITELAETIIKIVGFPVNIEYREERSGDIKDSLSNTTRIRTELGWYPKVSLEQGLRKTYRWYTSEMKFKPPV